ncbi:NFX1-type zinc finger-containing protein 1 isoform X2 [Cimex lectularius]|uniref:NFX1-type zinc finger-containing protein 1-like n=1 Tax=Cimex lectularius TaxID=79782 RepID=A0A8I6SKC3_CIMLE|nr:NFX1-type zinc finger-containing protein 1 isoform X2 [Cimex lectularius]
MIYELDLAKKEEKEKKEKKEEHDFLFEEEHDFLFEEEHDFLFEEEYDFFFNSTNLSDFFLNDDQSSRSDTQSLQRINFQSTDVPFFDNEDGIATIWEKPCFVNGSIDWHSILQLEEPMLIVLKLTDHLNDKESPSILIKDWHDLILLSDTLISVSKCKLNFHKESIILEMLSTEVLKVIIDLISEALTTIPSHEKLTVVNKLICFKEDVILYFDHLLEQVDITTLKSLLQLYVKFYEYVSINIHLNNDILDKLEVIIKKVNRHKFNSFNLCFPTNIYEKNEVYANLKVGAYKSVTDYITTHFLLLKEDFESVLRTGIHDYLTKKNCDLTEKSLNIYKNVRLSLGTSFIVKFTDEQNKQLDQVDWLNSKMFLYGSLILLTTNHFKTYFLAKVKNRKPLERGRGMLIISFLLVPDHIDFDALYILAEPTKYFEPFCSVMKILRQMPKYTFPFEKYLVHAVSNVKPPSYLHEGISYNIGEHSVIVSKRDTYPDPKTVGLNSNQMDSLFHALNHELCLIQGPPGTGKTFMCRQIVKVLLQNKHVWANKFNTPILIICYKNLSLDELLTGLLKDEVSVLRIGKRTKSKTLAKYSLRAIESPQFCDIFQLHKNNLKHSLFYVERKRYILFKIISMITENKGLIPFATLKPVLNSEETEYLSCIYLDWIFDMPVKDIKTSFKQHSTYAITEQDITVFKSKLKNSPTHFQNKNLNFKDLDKLCLCLKKLLNFKLNMEETKKSELLNANVKDITNVEDRWALYYLWLEKLKSQCNFFIKQLTEKQQNLDGKLNEIENILNSRKIGQNIVDVVGMTTTAGARLNILLDELKPRIVIIEEAAEIIESHCIASLNEHCQHVILFGDHKQLRPCIDCKEFATKYNFDLSLFERLINNGINPSVLNIQYRMRPEISALIAPAIYKYLQNDDSVTNQDDIKGVSKNVFFFDHLHHEHKGSKSSMYNDFEVHFALGLAHYFIMQGYEPCEITILTMYKEQANMLYEKQKNMLQKDHGKFKNLNDIIIATVDSYQGKENTIVIISLVRNNKNGHIGFLALENRVCVALSRARAGLFILGNMTILSKSSTLWQEVQTVLQKQNAIGKSLPLICQKKVHNTEAVSYNQLLVSSNTGCDHMCKQELKCGHNSVWLLWSVDTNASSCATWMIRSMKINSFVHYTMIICFRDSLIVLLLTQTKSRTLKILQNVNYVVQSYHVDTSAYFSVSYLKVENIRII